MKLFSSKARVVFERYFLKKELIFDTTKVVTVSSLNEGSQILFDLVTNLSRMGCGMGRVDGRSPYKIRMFAIRINVNQVFLN